MAYIKAYVRKLTRLTEFTDLHKADREPRLTVLSSHRLQAYIAYKLTQL